MSLYNKQLVYMSRIFINTNDIAALEGLSVKRASEIMRTIMDSLKKAKPNKLTIDEYCDYRGVQKNLVLNQMK